MVHELLAVSACSLVLCVQIGPLCACELAGFIVLDLRIRVCSNQRKLVLEEENQEAISRRLLQIGL